MVGAGVLDAELGGLLALMLGARIPVVVAGPACGDRDAFVDALVDLLPAEARVIELAGEAEEFAWMQEATELGWGRTQGVVPPGPDGSPRVSATGTVMLARQLAGAGPRAVGGARARIVVRALAIGYGLVAGMTANGLGGVLDGLHDASIGTDDGERSRLGVVLALDAPDGRMRVVAAHYVRPVSRDAGGHIQRLPPAVLATWNADAGRWDHFAWGVLPELAVRLGMRPVELELEQARRAADLRAAAAS
jgi:hypothetical protein